MLWQSGSSIGAMTSEKSNRERALRARAPYDLIPNIRFSDVPKDLTACIKKGDINIC